MNERMLTTSEAAELLNASPRTLEDWRLRGGGPIYCKVGTRLVRYPLTALEGFLSAGARINTGGGLPI